MPEQCGDRLTGHYRDHVLVCTLEPGHHGPHEAVVNERTVHWTPNNYWATTSEQVAS